MPCLLLACYGSAMPANGLTIEQLAAETGLTVRTIREHRARGLLQPPEVRERVGYYGDDHVARLRVIRQLQDDGFNLKGIKKLIEVSPSASSEALLGLREAATAPFETEEPETFTRESLVERFGEAADRLLEPAERVGALVPLGGDRYEAPAPALLNVAEEGVERGLPLTEMLKVIERVQRHCESVSRDFISLFIEEVWKPFEAEGFPQERWTYVLESIERLRPLASQAMLSVFQLTMSREAEAAFGKEVKRLMERKS
jgi:DNA-binding transcriptional MerR regulator